MVWIIPLIGLAGGITLGVYFNIAVSAVYAQYLSIIILTSLDSLLDGYADFFEQKFDALSLMTGFFSSTLLAVGLTYLGQCINVDLYIAVMFVFIFRIMTNFDTIRRLMIRKRRHGKRITRPHKGGDGIDS